MNGGTAVVVVSYGSSNLLEHNLGPLSRERPDLLVVVVDSFSTITEREATTALCHRAGWTLVAPATNTGYGVGNNLGVAAARERGATRFLLLNPDARIDGDSVSRLESVVAADPTVLASPVVRTTQGTVWFDGIDLLLSSGRMRATRRRPVPLDQPVRMWLSGAALMIDAQLWDQVGGFDDRYFLYWEDVDLSWRCEQVGGRLAVVRDAAAVHDEGATHGAGGSRARSNVYYYYNVRNRLLFAGQHLEPRLRRRWLRHSGREAWNILLRGGRRQLLESPGPAWAALRGTFDGVRVHRQAARRADRAARPDPLRVATPLRVLQSFPVPRPTTNPYIVMLRDALAADPDVALSTWSWRRALGEHHDVFHAHWPEILVSGNGRVKKAVRQTLFLAFLLRLRLQGTAVVRTRHNLELPQGISRRERALLRLFERWTDLEIVLNASAEHPEAHLDHAAARRQDVARETIVHGHYRDWFAELPRPAQVPGRLGYVGLIRRYKAVDALLRAFAQTARDGAGLSLSVGGRPSTDELRTELTQLAASDPRVHLHLEFLSEAELVAAVAESELVVLAYREMHNSGGVLAALSVGRPVLVPDNEVNRALAHEVGTRWVVTFEPPLTGQTLVAALARVREAQAADPDAVPDLSGRDWSRTAAAHVEAYRRARQLRRGRARR